jgi:hypothetical protein
MREMLAITDGQLQSMMTHEVRAIVECKGLVHGEGGEAGNGPGGLLDQDADSWMDDDLAKLLEDSDDKGSLPPVDPRTQRLWWFKDIKRD